MMYTLEQIQTILKEVKPEILQKYSVNELGIYGSFARGEANGNSRIRVLAEFDVRPGMAKFIGLSHQLQSLFGIKVEVVDRRKLRTKEWEEISSEVIYI